MKKIRNIGIMAHVDAGKTTATERILYYTGLTHKMGNVDDGNTVMDTNPQESKRGITISSAAISTQWKYNHEMYQINLIDTPGHVDFSIEVERSLRVLDGAIALFCAASGVEPQSENVWHLGNKYNVPRICFVNKMDRQGADFLKVVAQIEEELSAKTLVLQIPIGSEDDFIGIIDLITMKAHVWNTVNGETWTETEIPFELISEAEEMKKQLLETLAEYDEEFFEVYFEKNIPLSKQAIIDAIQRTTIKMDLFPVLCGSAFKNKGLQPLLDAVARYLPGPQELPELTGMNITNQCEIIRQRTIKEPFTALAFKINVDKHVGKLTMIRVYCGQLLPGSTLLNARTNEHVRVNRIMEVSSDNYLNKERAVAGEICAFVGLKDVKTGDTLCALENPIVLESIDIPEPVISLCIEPKTRQDLKVFGQALAFAVEEDPSLQVEVVPQTGETILKGMGELHLEVVIEKLRLTHKLALNKGAPKVAYKEKLSNTLKHRERFVKQTGGSGQFADITFTMGPREDGKQGLELINKIKGGAIPNEYIPSIKKGFMHAMQTGVLGGYPLENLSVTLLDGEIHREDSNAMDFEIAARNGFKTAALLADSRLLEPIMRVEIETVDAYTGVINSDLNRRRGIVVSLNNARNRKLITTEIPLSNTFGYISDLRTITSGRATISMQFSHYSEVPRSIATTVLNKGL